MSRLVDAMFDPWLVVVLVIFVFVAVAAFAADAAGWLQPDYRKLLFGMVLSYGACVLVKAASRRP